MLSARWLRIDAFDLVAQIPVSGRRVKVNPVTHIVRYSVATTRFECEAAFKSGKLKCIIPKTRARPIRAEHLRDTMDDRALLVRDMIDNNDGVDALAASCCVCDAVGGVYHSAPRCWLCRLHAQPDCLATIDVPEAAYNRIAGSLDSLREHLRLVLPWVTGSKCDLCEALMG